MSLPVSISTELISPIELLKIIFLSEIINDDFFCDLIKDDSVFVIE